MTGGTILGVVDNSSSAGEPAIFSVNIAAATPTTQLVTTFASLKSAPGGLSSPLSSLSVDDAGNAYGMAYNSESNEVGVYKLSGLGQGGSTGDEPVVEFGDSTTKLFVSKKSVIQVPEASVVAAAGDGTPMVSILAVPAAKKGDKQKTTTVNIDVILNPVGSVVTSAIQVAFDLNLAMTTAKVGTDYLGPVSGVVDFQPGQTIQTIAVKFVTAKLTEAEQAVVYQITSVTNAVLGSNSSTTIDCIDANLGEAEMAHLILRNRERRTRLSILRTFSTKAKASRPRRRTPSRMCSPSSRV